MTLTNFYAARRDAALKLLLGQDALAGPTRTGGIPETSGLTSASNLNPAGGRLWAHQLKNSSH
jgi:hypothetical protein